MGEVKKEDILNILDGYDKSDITIATLGSHTSLHILQGAKEEGFKTAIVCEKGREEDDLPTSLRCRRPGTAEGLSRPGAGGRGRLSLRELFRARTPAHPFHSGLEAGAGRGEGRESRSQESGSCIRDERFYGQQHEQALPEQSQPLQGEDRHPLPAGRRSKGCYRLHLRHERQAAQETAHFIGDGERFY